MIWYFMGLVFIKFNCETQQIMIQLKYYKKDKILRVYNESGCIKTFEEVEKDNIMDHSALSRWLDTPLLRYKKKDIQEIKIYNKF